MSTSPSSRERRLDLVISGFAITWILALVVGEVVRHASTVDFFPLNGSFQSYNPVRRLIADQSIGADFSAYLGLGPTWLTRAAMFATGEDFHGSLVAAYALNALLHALLVFTVVRLLGRKTSTALVASALMTTFAALGRVWFLPTELATWFAVYHNEVFHPGYSSLGLRAAAPTLVVGAWYALRNVRGLGGAERAARRALVTGALAGIAAVWSNDFGVPTAAAFLVYAWVVECHAVPRARFVTLSCASALLFALATAACGTRGAVSAWFTNDVLAVARDQSWFFVDGPWLEAREHPARVMPLIGGVALLVLVARWRSRSRDPRDALILVLVFATLGAGLIAASARPTERYYFPLARVLVVALPCVAFDAAQAWRSARRSHARSSRRIPARWSTATLAVFLGWSYLALRDGAFVKDAAHELPRADVPTLGGSLSLPRAAIVALADQVRMTCDERHMAPDERVFSFYAGAFDVLSGAFQPTGSDYVIHSIGRERRARYLAVLRATKAPFATTIHPDFSPWEEWIRRRFWPEYVELLRRYEPIASTDYLVLWRTRETALASVEATVLVSMLPAEAGHVPFELTLAAHDGAEYLVELEIQCDPARTRLGFPRSLLLVEPEREGPARAIAFAPGQSVVVTCVKLRVGISTRMEMRLLGNEAEIPPVPSIVARPRFRASALVPARQ